MLAVKDKRKEGWSTKVMAKISVLSVISFLLMFFEFPIVWLAPAFMEFDISDLPALIGAFAMGPMAGVIIELIKNILNVVVKGTTTAVVGEVANFVVGSAFVFTAGLVYQRKKSYKNAVMGLILGTIAMTAVISLANYYVMFPFYANLFGLPIEEAAGSLLSGDKPFIEQARTYRKMLGGGMRQIGILAAAGIYALENHVNRLKDDHEHAKAIADALNKTNWAKVTTLGTNIIFFKTLNEEIAKVVEEFKQNGFLILAEGNEGRIVTNINVSDEDTQAMCNWIKNRG